jgi:hypothetical protein
MKSMSKSHIIGRALAVAMTFGISAVAHAQGVNLEPQTVLPPTVEGNWVRTDTIGSQSFDGLTKTFTPAELTPKGKEEVAKTPQRGGQRPETRSATGAIVTNPTPCIYNGGQLTMEYDSEGFQAVKTKSEFVFVQDRGADRHVYLNKTELPDSNLRTPTPSGFSIGHIEPNGTLVVKTTDLVPGRVTAGGYRTANTVVEQKYIPDADGKHLEIVFTWTDPEIYAKPHTYKYTFERLPAGAYSLDEFCDATNPLEGQSVVAPPQP